MTRVTVDLWSDITCPWCAIGYTQFAKAMAAVNGEIEVDLRFMPFELNPGFPAEGRTQAAHFAAVMGKSDSEIAAMRAHVEAAGDKAGFSMRYSGDAAEAPPAMVWNTFSAHKLLRWALAAKGPEEQARLKKALLEAHFQKRKNMADEEVLLSIAEVSGFNRAEAREALADEALTLATQLEAQRGRELGINSVPSFVFAGKYLVQGAREPEDFEQVSRKVAQEQEEAAGAG